MKGYILKLYELNTKRRTFDDPERKSIETTKSMLCVEDTHLGGYQDEVFNCICGAVIDRDHAFFSPKLTNERYSPYYVCPSCYQKQKHEVDNMDKPELSALSVLVEVDKSNENEELHNK